MTMADRVAVMNHGRIEQLGPPSDLYEAPTTTFVANFLGQSNLVRARRVDTDGDYLVVDCHGQRAGIRTDRCVREEDLLLGVRPEKIRILSADETPPSGLNLLTGGTVVDASYLGVSTQYLVRMPWGQLITVFAQNLGVGERFGDGAPVQLAWERDHSFGLAGDAEAGRDEDTDPGADREEADQKVGG